VVKQIHKIYRNETESTHSQQNRPWKQKSFYNNYQFIMKFQTLLAVG